MPAYEVEHICELTDDQKDQLAEAITKIHSQQFSTPRVFVNVRITDISDQRTYVAGKQVSYNFPKEHNPSAGQIQIVDIHTVQKQSHLGLRETWPFTNTIRL